MADKPAEHPTAPPLDARDLAPEALLGEAERMGADGWRPATLTCVSCSDQGAELLYHFQRGMELCHYRLRLPQGAVPDSLTSLFPCVFLAENEVQDQFGLPFKGLEPDLKGRLYMHGGKPPLRTDAAPEAGEADGEADQKAAGKTDGQGEQA